MRARPTWVVVNQSHSPAFQRMVVRLADDLGPCLLLSGLPHPGDTGRVTVVPGPGYDRRRLRHRAVSWLRFLTFAAARLATVAGRPFVWAVTNPPMLPHLAWALGRTRRLPYGLLVWDVYPDHVVQLGWLGAGHPAVRAWRGLNRLALTEARVVMALGEGMAAALEAQADPEGLPRPVEVVPNWADTDAIRPLDKAENPFARQHGQVGKVTVLYSGNMGATHGLGAIAQAAARLRDHADLAFLFVGDGLGLADVEAVVRSESLSNVGLLGLQPWEALPRSLATGDIAVVVQAPGTEHLSVPSKTYNALAAGSALLAVTAPGTDLARLVTAHDVGVVCPHGDVDALAAGIRSLLVDPEKLAGCRERARRLAEARFSESAVGARLAALLARAMEGPT